MIFYNKEIFKRCFYYPKKYWYKNIKRIPHYFKLIHHLVKYGYDEYATWETFDWFIQTIRAILIDYRENHCGSPIIIDDFPFERTEEQDKILYLENKDKWNAVIDRMIELLVLMDENNSKYNDDYYYGNNKQNEEMGAAKDEFFKLFSKYFYSLWD